MSYPTSRAISPSPVTSFLGQQVGLQRDILSELRNVVDELQTSNSRNAMPHPPGVSFHPGAKKENSVYPSFRGTAQADVSQDPLEVIDEQDDLFETMVDRMEAYPNAMWPILDKGIRIALNSIQDNNLKIVNRDGTILNPEKDMHLDLVANWSDYINDADD